VKEAMEKLGIKGTVRFYGTPAEENFSGKVYMARDGLFDDVDAALSHHPSDMNAATLLSSLAVRSCRFQFFGRASHASVSPEEGRSALDGVELMNIGVNYLREHVIQEARIHYVIERGGEQPNIVPEYARSWYYIRAPEVDQLESIFERVVDIARGAALMSGTKVDVEILDAMYNVIPNGPIAAKIVDNMRSLGVPELSEEERRFAEEIAKTIPIQTKENELRKSKRPGWERLIDKLIDDEVPEPWGDGDYMMGSTDVGDVSWKAPTVEFNTAAWVLGTPAHSWQSTAQSGSPLARRSLIFASKVMSLTALDLLTDEDLLERAKEDHSRRLRGRAYKPLIPESLTPPLNFWRDQFKV
jgi:Metal-dependent amidase/aminoacylase/carboxypeptidase